MDSVIKIVMITSVIRGYLWTVKRLNIYAGCLLNLAITAVALFIAVTTVLSNAAPVWVTGRGAGQPFQIRAIVNYPVQYGIMYPFI